MKAIRIAAAITNLFSLCLICAACEDAQELSSTAIILGVGIDGGEGQIELTVELSSADSEEAIVLQAKDGSIDACVKSIQLSNYEHLYWGGTAAVIFGSDLADEYAECCALYLYSDLGVSGKTPVLKAWNCSGADILKGQFGQARYTAVGIGEALRIVESGNNAAFLTLAQRLETQMEQGEQERTAMVTIDEDGSVKMVDTTQ